MDFPATEIKGGIVSKKLRIVTLLNDHMSRYLTEERYVT